MVKKILFLSLLVGLFLAGGLLYAAGVPEVNYTWTKIGDDLFGVWQVNGNTFFVENVEDYNINKLREAAGNGLKNLSWGTAKANRAKLGLRTSIVKYISKDGMKGMENKVFYTQAKYGANKQLFLKVIRDFDKIWLAKADNEESPEIYSSKNNNYFVFTDEEGIWNIKPVIGDTVSFETVKLSADTVNGKTRSQIRATIKSEDDYLLWNSDPAVSTNGSYLVYISNKDSYSKNLKGPDVRNDLWIINTSQGTDKLVLTAPRLTRPEIFKWISDNIFVYSLAGKYYFYNAKENLSSLFLKDADLLNLNENIAVYSKNDNTCQIFFYNFNTQKEIALPPIPQNVMVQAHFSSGVFSPSPDSTKLLVYVTEDDPNIVKRAIYLIDNNKRTISKITWPAGEKRAAFGKWLDNANVMIYTTPDIGGIEYFKTWILHVE
jgi:hypothetical protein